jgi:hypothetical protein
MPAPMSASWIMSLGERVGEDCARRGFNCVAVAAMAAAWMNFLRSSIVKRVSLSPLNSRFELGVGKEVAEVMAFHSSSARRPKQLLTIHRWISQTQPTSESDDKYSRALGF